MEKRKPKIEDKKRRGEWAEMIFTVRAAERGIAISKPWGDTTSYDFVVGRPGRFRAVQVKCAIFEIAEGLDKGWLCTVCGSGRPYARGSFDFLAAYLVYEDAWYIIPEEETLKKIDFAGDELRRSAIRRVPRSVAFAGGQTGRRRNDRYSGVCGGVAGGVELGGPGVQ